MASSGVEVCLRQPPPENSAAVIRWHQGLGQRLKAEVVLVSGKFLLSVTCFWQHQNLLIGTGNRSAG